MKRINYKVNLCIHTAYICEQLDFRVIIYYYFQLYLGEVYDCNQTGNC